MNKNKFENKNKFDKNEKLVIFLRNEKGYAFSTMTGTIVLEDQEFPTLQSAIDYAEAAGLDYFVA